MKKIFDEYIGMVKQTKYTTGYFHHGNGNGTGCGLGGLLWGGGVCSTSDISGGGGIGCGNYHGYDAAHGDGIGYGQHGDVFRVDG